MSEGLGLKTISTVVAKSKDSWNEFCRLTRFSQCHVTQNQSAMLNLTCKGGNFFIHQLHACTQRDQVSLIDWGAAVNMKV